MVATPGRSRWCVTLLLCAVLAASAGCREASETLETVRIGWQVPWATQGQLAQSLKHTNALALNNLRGDFKGFSYGGPLNEAALAGAVDVLFTADQPAATLLARSRDWRIVARLMFNRVALYVPPASPITSVASLKGKTVAVPFGAAAQRVALQAMRDAGLNPDLDVNVINLDIYEQNSVVQAGTARSWGKIDAMGGFDPTPALLEHRGLARMLHVGNVTSVVVMSRDMVERRPDTAARFLKAFVLAYYFYATHAAEADAWFQSESRLSFEPEVLALAASIEPNVRATEPQQIDVSLGNEEIGKLQDAANFIHEQKLVPVLVNMREHIDQRPLTRALDDLRRDSTSFTLLVGYEGTPAVDRRPPK
jgi:sulfonate transport system substrate-binding protein